MYYVMKHKHVTTLDIIKFKRENKNYISGIILFTKYDIFKIINDNYIFYFNKQFYTYVKYYNKKKLIIDFPELMLL